MFWRHLPRAIHKPPGRVGQDRRKWASLYSSKLFCGRHSPGRSFGSGSQLVPRLWHDTNFVPKHLSQGSHSRNLRIVAVPREQPSHCRWLCPRESSQLRLRQPSPASSLVQLLEYQCRFHLNSTVTPVLRLLGYLQVASPRRQGAASYSGWLTVPARLVLVITSNLVPLRRISIERVRVA